MRINLKDWSVTGYWPYATILNKSVETGIPLLGITKTMSIEYPCDVYTILKQHGVIPDPYYGNNSLACEWVPSRWWQFENIFHVDKPAPNKHWRLVIEGIDYHGNIHINELFLKSKFTNYYNIQYKSSSLSNDELLYFFVIPYAVFNIFSIKIP
ncbi:MAG: hypothetical protein E7480_03200 [Ruminococcaceae bacterium]|nr:hypothetical protein [Oscillospiraceae bacterium]